MLVTDIGTNFFTFLKEIAMKLALGCDTTRWLESPNKFKRVPDRIKLDELQKDNSHFA